MIPEIFFQYSENNFRFCGKNLNCYKDSHVEKSYSLAPNFVWERGIVLLVWVCDSVCLFVVLLFRDQDNSKSSRPISIKIGRTLSYIKNKAKFKFDKNCFGRTRTLSNRKFKISITQKVIAKYLQNFTEWCVKSFLIWFVNLKQIAPIERKLRPKICLIKTADVIELI